MQNLDVLLIDPIEEDRRRFLEVFEEGKITNQVHAVTSGDEALAFLQHRDPYEDTPDPGLIVLEIDLPNFDGHELLEGFEETPDPTPVLVLSQSDDAEDIAKSYKLNASAYITKPVDSDAFIDAVRAIEQFWVQFVTLPPED